MVQVNRSQIELTDTKLTYWRSNSRQHKTKYIRAFILFIRQKLRGLVCVKNKAPDSSHIFKRHLWAFCNTICIVFKKCPNHHASLWHFHKHVINKTDQCLSDTGRPNFPNWLWVFCLFVFGYCIEGGDLQMQTFCLFLWFLFVLYFLVQILPWVECLEWSVSGRSPGPISSSSCPFWIDKISCNSSWCLFLDPLTVLEDAARSRN